jgi:hypothetical protein
MTTTTENKTLALSQEIVALLKDAQGRYEHFPGVGMDALWLAALALYGSAAARHVESLSVVRKEL